MELIFLGTGVSTAIPVMGHLSKGCACFDAINTPGSRNLRNNVSILLRKRPTEEKVKEIGEPPENSLHNAEWQMRRAGAEVNILFDCGKTFRAAYFNVLAKLGVAVISALLITHEHADAAAGLDDLRDLIPIRNTGSRLEVYQVIAPCPTYMTLFTLKSLARTVGYILRYSRFLNATRREGLTHSHAQSTDLIGDYVFHDSKEGGPRGIPTTAEEYDTLLRSTPPLGATDRRVTSLDVIILPEAVQRFYVKGLTFPMYSFPVFHGGDYVCTAYAFGSGLRVRSGKDGQNEDESAARLSKGAAEANTLSAAGDILSWHERTYRSVVYMSDVSSIGPASQGFLDSLEPVDLLVVDLLLGPNEQHFSHWCFDDVIEFTRKYQPKVVLGVGMWCTIEHAEMNALLTETLAKMKSKDPTLRTEFIGLAYDGLTLKIA